MITMEKKRLISHRGNLDGKSTSQENNPNYIDIALSKGYDVEIDLWFYNDNFYLGHDGATYLVELNWLVERSLRLWVHCKDLKTIEELKRLEYENGINSIHYFYHENDDTTITSQGKLWVYPGKQPIQYSIAVMPEIHNEDVSKCMGICSDVIEKYKENE